MKQSLSKSIVIITSLALVGLIAMQVFWVQNAVRLQEEQFLNNTRVAMKSVLNQILEHNIDSLSKRLAAKQECEVRKSDIREAIHPHLLDSLIRLELGCMNVSKGYYYGIYNRLNNKFIMGNFQEHEKDLEISDLQFSVAALYKPGDYYLSIYFPLQKSMILGRMIQWLILSAVFIIIVIFSYWYTIVTYFRQKRLSEMKTDFINNMTHEFKTPIATVSLASEMLMRPDVQYDNDKTQKYARVINEENARLQNQVEQILQLAILEHEETKLKIKSFNIHPLIEKTKDSFGLLLREKSGQIDLKLLAENSIVQADKTHITNVIFNLIDNAIKYSHAPVQVTISSRSTKNGFWLSIADKGIGISVENQKEIFKNLYRVSTGDRHDVKGFGIGLYYVKKIIDQHGGKVQVESELGKGSVFRIFLPFANTINTEQDG